VVAGAPLPAVAPGEVERRLDLWSFDLHAFRVLRSPKKHETEDALYAAALRGLTRRAYSVHEMRKWLADRATARELAEAVLARAKERGYLDDARYARQFARQRAEGWRQGRFRIARDLRARGVADQHIEAALGEVFAETDQAALLRKRIERKLRALRGKDTAGAQLDQRKMASLYASLLRAGFPADMIRRELHALGKPAESLPEEEPAETAEG